MALLPPGLVLGLVVTLLLAQLFHSLLHHGRRAYFAVLILTSVGVCAGQLWDVLGLPVVRLGQLNMLPALAFATALQALAKRLSVVLLR